MRGLWIRGSGCPRSCSLLLQTTENTARRGLALCHPMSGFVDSCEDEPSRTATRKKRALPAAFPQAEGAVLRWGHDRAVCACVPGRKLRRLYGDVGNGVGLLARGGRKPIV